MCFQFHIILIISNLQYTEYATMFYFPQNRISQLSMTFFNVSFPGVRVIAAESLTRVLGKVSEWCDPWGRILNARNLMHRSPVTPIFYCGWPNIYIYIYIYIYIDPNLISVIPKRRKENLISIKLISSAFKYATKYHWCARQYNVLYTDVHGSTMHYTLMCMAVQCIIHWCAWQYNVLYTDVHGSTMYYTNF